MLAEAMQETRRRGNRKAYGKEPDTGKRVRHHRHLRPTISAVLLPADAIRHGRPVHRRPIHRRRRHHGSGQWQPGAVHAHRRDRRPGHGLNRDHRPGGRREPPRLCGTRHRQHHHPFRGNRNRTHRSPAGRHPRHRSPDRNTGRSSRRYHAIPADLLRRRPVHRRLQHHQLHLPRSRRFYKPNGFHRSGLRMQYRTRLPVHGTLPTRTRRRRTRHHARTNHQRDCGARRHAA